MGRYQALYDLQRVFNCQRSGQSSLGKPLAKSFAFQQFANDVRSSLVYTDVVNCDDVRVIESGSRTRLQLKTAKMIWIGAGCGANEFESDFAIQSLIPRT